MPRYARPSTVAEALALLADGRWRCLAGGTDVYPALGDRPLADDVLDLNDLEALCGIAESDGDIVIGARTTWSALLAADLPPAFDALRQAAREVGSVQIQNAGTVAGNLCNASPAADGVPPLLALDAAVELASQAGTRRLPLADFLRGNRETALAGDELMVAVRVPKAAARGRSAFLKLGARRYLVIAIAMVAARLTLDGAGRIAEAAIAVGACSPVARRLARLETALAGRTAGADSDAAVAAHPFDELAPIDDVRGTADYRRAAVREIVARAVRLAGAPRDAGKAA
ncbi:FAD binding domain-containing protein [Aquibium sp. A9E412]|uniref:FAD binding domain-containing protein n=1 Tax=Aquibium sp. A9E412 TaxID=2976767 RepID=UPI0025B18F8C|nr:FAD binding domain-containing protein [Aquibium sp. A9E412]MDN2566912.1 FAD binding domain-containing protein [Aquibium sp. A9E412]